MLRSRCRPPVDRGSVAAADIVAGAGRIAAGSDDGAALGAAARQGQGTQLDVGAARPGFHAQPLGRRPQGVLACLRRGVCVQCDRAAAALLALDTRASEVKGTVLTSVPSVIYSILTAVYALLSYQLPSEPNVVGPWRCQRWRCTSGLTHRTYQSPPCVCRNRCTRSMSHAAHDSRSGGP